MGATPSGSARDETADESGEVVVRYWAAARAAAGVECDVVEVEGAVTLAWVLDLVRSRHGDRPDFARVLSVCSVLVGDAPMSGREAAGVTVRPGMSVEMLPPFAGG